MEHSLVGLLTLGACPPTLWSCLCRVSGGCGYIVGVAGCSPGSGIVLLQATPPSWLTNMWGVRIVVTYTLRLRWIDCQHHVWSFLPSSPVPPDSPSNVMVTSVGNSSLSLSWTNGFDGFSPFSNVVISYEVDRYPQEGTQAQTFPMGTSATLVGLHPYSNYTLHVSLTNAVGFISNPTNINVTTLSLSKSLELNWY